MSIVDFMPGPRMSPSECYSRTGCLTKKHVEELLEKSEQPSASDILEGYSEGELQVGIGEDFFDSITDELNDLKKSLRGKNREALESIMENIELLINEVNQKVEYSNEKIEQLFRDLKEV